MTEDNRKELKLIYRGSKLERIELEGVPLEGLAVLLDGKEVITLGELMKKYRLEYEYIK